MRFSEFIRNASPEEKGEVYGKVMERVAEQQSAVIASAALISADLAACPTCGAYMPYTSRCRRPDEFADAFCNNKVSLS
jgi:hypothetical protein